ncbi:MAG TPA: DUF2079 domain-containing protein [Candidatus Saccharimonadales bacterium]|nr:DUF2079 domain-containing protein [Candidatus Saccharimonadales bacterium]
MKNKTLEIFKFFIGWPLTIVALIFVVKFILPNIPAVVIAIRNLNFFILFLGILCLVIYFFIRCFFWQQMLLQKNVHIAFKEMTWLWGSSEFHRYIPGNIWTFLGRTTNFAQKNISTKVTLSLFLQEVEFIVVSSVLLSLFALNFMIYGLLPDFPYKNVIIIIICIVSLLGILCFLGNRYVFKKILVYKKLGKIILYIFPQYSLQTNFKLFFIQTIALFFFGLGTYFSISSFTLLYPLYLPTFVGFFVFSLLVGYISFITPMGLGVREGIITTGLGKFITLSLAGFSALFARFVFIIAELLFLFLAYGWYKSKSKYFIIFEKIIKKHWQVIVLGILIVIYVIYMNAASFARYDNFYAGRFDLGNMDQTVWNTLHGRIFQTTDANGTSIVSRLAFHADFILILLAPFYMLWQNPKMLLIIQTVILACGSIFVFLLAKDVLKNKNTALLFSCSYLLNPSIAFTNLYDFHPITLATTFLLGAFYFLKKNNMLWVIIFLILAGLTKEEVWVITALFGIYIILLTRGSSFKKNVLRIFGFCVFLISMGIAYYLVMHAIPAAKGGAHFALAYYADFGSSPSQILKTIFFNPQKTFMTILQPGQLLYLFELFAPLGFLSFFSPLFLLFTGPDLTVDLLSNSQQFHQIYYQYSASITPFIFISAIYGFKIFLKIFPRFQKQIIYYLLITTVLNAYFFGPLPGSKHPSLTMFDSPLNDAAVIENFLTDIPKRYSIAATNNVGAHLSHRQKIFTIPVGIDQADIVIFLLNDTYAQPSLDAQKKIAEKLKSDKNYIEVFKQGDFIVFEKRNLYLQKEPNVTHARLFPMSIPSLQHRDYIGGEITYERKITDKHFATTYLISYPSDGLKQYAFMEIPNGDLPKNGFPVIVLTHDISAKQYSTVGADTSIADYFAYKRFLVLKPDYRGNADSETDTASLAPLPYSVDVLNLISSLTFLREADNKNVFLWGQGLGGEVSLKIVEITGDNEDTALKHRIKGVVLWSPIIDPKQWFNEADMYDTVVKNFGSLSANPIFWQSISPKNYIDDIQTPIEIDQGTNDTIIPYTSSIELYDDLVSFNKNTKLRLFPNDDHDLTKYNKQALLGNVNFFRKLISF